MGAATTRLALPYPVGGDTPDVPRDISALTTKLETLIDPTALTLPATPYDGQVAYFSPLAGVVWAFRYNAGSASTYKWEFCGGSCWLVQQAGLLVVNPTTAGAWVDDANTPALTLPRAGEYVVAHGVFMSNTAGSQGVLADDVWYTPPAGSLTQGNVQNSVVLAVGFTDGRSQHGAADVHAGEHRAQAARRRRDDGR